MKVGDLVMFVDPIYPEEDLFNGRIGLITKKVGTGVRVDWLKSYQDGDRIGRYSHFNTSRFEVISSAGE